MRATKGIRTLDLAFTKRLLYRLSYGGLQMSGGDYKGERPISQVFNHMHRL